MRPPTWTLTLLSSALPDGIFRLLVRPQATPRGMAEPVVPGPFAEGDLPHVQRLNPVRVPGHVPGDLTAAGAGLLFERGEQRGDLVEGRVGESGAHMPGEFDLA